MPKMSAAGSASSVGSGTKAPSDGEPRSSGSDGRVNPKLLDNAYHVAKDHVLANFEEEYVTRLVARAQGNVSRAARLASVDRTTLYRLMEKHGFRRDDSSGTME